MSEATDRLSLGIDLNDPDVAADLAKGERQLEFARKRDENLTQARVDRIRRLTDDRAAIDAAVNAYGALPHTDAEEITLRRRFIELDPPRAPRDPGLRYDRRADIESRPPLTKLINRPGNTLQVYLSMLFVAQTETPAGAAPTNKRDNNFRSGWAYLAGLKSANIRQTNRRFGRAVDRLAEDGLVHVGAKGVKGRYDRFKIRKEDGSEEPYFVPNGGLLVSVPVGFFRQGWHLVLTANELATYLVILNHTLRVGARTEGVAIPESVRETRYGLSEEAYRAAHELSEFGLIDLHKPDGSAGAAGGEDESRLPLRFTHPPVVDHDFSRPAVDVVVEALSDRSLPPRLSKEPAFKGFVPSPTQ